MAEMAFGALLFCTNIIDALPKEGVEPLIGVLFKTWPSFLDVSLQLGKKTPLWDWNLESMVGGTATDTCIKAQLFNSVRMMEGCIIHNKHGLWLRPPPAVLEELLNKRFEQHGNR